MGIPLVTGLVVSPVHLSKTLKPKSPSCTVALVCEYVCEELHEEELSSSESSLQSHGRRHTASLKCKIGGVHLLKQDLTMYGASI